MLGNRRQKTLNTDLKCWHFQDDFNLGATSVFLLRVKQFKTLRTFPWMPHFPASRLPLPVQCLLLPWSLTSKNIPTLLLWRVTSGKMIERVGGPLEAASASSHCPKQFSSGSNLHAPFNCTTCLWFTGPPILRQSFKEHLLWCEHLGSFIYPSQATCQSFPSPTSSAALFSLSPEQCFSILYRSVLCVPPHVT